jgi:predicted  nucleic acid-binding Zn-ribbon protein
MMGLRQANLQTEKTRLKRLEDEHVADMKKLQRNIAQSQKTVREMAIRLRKIKAKEQQVNRILQAKRRAQNQMDKLNRFSR